MARPKKDLNKPSILSAKQHHEKVIKCAQDLIVLLGGYNGELHTEIKQLMRGSFLKTRFENSVKNLNNILKTPYENK